MPTLRPDRVALLRATSPSPRHLTDRVTDARQGDLLRVRHLGGPEEDGLDSLFAPLFRARREAA